MFLSKANIEEINNIFKENIKIKYIDDKEEAREMQTFYDLEDYIKKNIYEKKYPGLLEDNINLQQEKEEEIKPNFKENEQAKKEEIITTSKKYKINSCNNNRIVPIPKNYSTDDENEYNALTLLNQDHSEGNEYGWTTVIDKGNTKTYYKFNKIEDENGKEKDGITFFVETIIDYPASSVSKYFNDFEFRKEFDELFKKGELITEEENNEQNLKIQELYLYMKMPLIFSDRDFTVQKKIWNDYNNEKESVLVNMTSIITDKYPAKEKPVRAEMKNRSVYICPYGENQCKFFLSTCIDMKLDINVSMMAKKGGEGQYEWVKKFISAIKSHEG